MNKIIALLCSLSISVVIQASAHKTTVPQQLTPQQIAIMEHHKAVELLDLYQRKANTAGCRAYAKGFENKWRLDFSGIQLDKPTAFPVLAQQVQPKPSFF